MHMMLVLIFQKKLHYFKKIHKVGGGESDPRNLESRYVVERYRAEKRCPDEVAKSTVANKIYIF